MNTHLDFNSTDPQPFSDMGGDHVALYVDCCRHCNRNVYAVRDVKSTPIEKMAQPYAPDPRGMIGPRNALYTIEAEQFDMTGPDVNFCWDCVNEHGSEGYQACLVIARKLWKPTQQAVRCACHDCEVCGAKKMVCDACRMCTRCSTHLEGCQGCSASEACS